MHGQSDQIVGEVTKILLRHIDPRTLDKVMQELMDVRGAKSFREIVEAFIHAIEWETGKAAAR
jgi:hypothetical protein